jgi:pimeloyl-ACP methyl ester carboxylesterase
MTSETQFLARPQGRIAYDVTGQGPLVLLVPGMGDLRSTYRFLVPELVAAGYTAVTADLRGHGESDIGFTSYGDVDTAADLAALLEALGSPAVVVGNSMAAGSAAYLAVEHPDLVRGLVLVGPFVRDPRTSAVQRLMMRVGMAAPLAATTWKAYLPRLYAGRRPDDFDAQLARVIASFRRPGYAKAFSLTTRTTHAPVEARLADVSAPTLVIMGELDPDFPDPAAEARWIADRVNGEVHLVPEAGHYPHAQRPDLVASAVIALAQRVHADA